MAEAILMILDQLKVSPVQLSLIKQNFKIPTAKSNLAFLFCFGFCSSTVYSDLLFV